MKLRIGMLLATLLTLGLIAGTRTVSPPGVRAADCDNSWGTVTSGKWADPFKWTLQHVPTSSENVCVNSGDPNNSEYAIVVDGNMSAASLTIGFSRATVDIWSSGGITDASLTLVNGGTNAGVILFDDVGTNSCANDHLIISGTATLTNTGTITSGVQPVNFGPCPMVVQGNIDNQGTLNVQLQTNLEFAYNGYSTGLTNSTGAITVDAGSTLTVDVNENFAMTGGMLTNNGTFRQVGSGFTFSGGVFTGHQPLLSGVNLNVAGSGTGEFNLIGTIPLAGDVGAGIKLHLASQGAVADAALHPAGAFTNLGTIALDDAGASCAGDTILASGASVFTNAGTLTSNAPSGFGPCGHLVQGNFVNTGVVSLHSNLELTYNGAGNTATNSTGAITVDAGTTLLVDTSESFVMTGGTLTNNGTFRQVGSGFTFSGGAFTGHLPQLQGVSLSVAGSGTGEFNLIGATPLTGDVGANIKLHLASQGAVSDATLQPTGAVTNLGTIALDDAGASCAGDTILASGASVFTNAGTLTSNAPSGFGPCGHLVQGNFVNTGVLSLHSNLELTYNGVGQTATNSTGAITVDAGSTLLVDTGENFVMTGGTLTNNGSVHQVGDSFTFSGGVFTGHLPQLQGVSLSVAGNGTGEFNLIGATPLTGDVGANIKLHLASQGAVSDATLQPTGAVTNLGSIAFDDAGASCAGDTILASGGTVFTNAGTLTSNAVNFGPCGHLVQGNFVNTGVLSLHSNLEFTYNGVGNTATNSTGAITVDAGSTLLVDTGENFAMTGGTLANNGSVHQVGDSFTFSGGVFTGHLPLLSGVNLNVAGSGMGEFNLIGAIPLSGDVGANIKLHLASQNGVANATLQPAGAFTNLGSIAFDDAGSSCAGDTILASGGTVFTNAGTLTSNAVSFGPCAHLVQGNFVNSGVLNLHSNLELTYNGVGNTATNDAGGVTTVDAGVTLLVDTGESFVNNGTLSLFGTFSQSSGTFTAGSASTTTINIGGVTAGSQFGQFTFTGAPVTLAGTLNAILVNSFVPAISASFVVMNAGSIAADFSVYHLAPGHNVLFQQALTSTTLTLNRVTGIQVNEVSIPANDPGKFNLQINGVTAGTGANAASGGSTGVVLKSPGAYTVGQTGGTGTNTVNYTTAIGGDCAANGAVTLVAGDGKVCTITNAFAQGALLTVNEVTVPAGDTGTFTLQIDGTTAGTGRNIGNGGSTGAVLVGVGAHTVSQIAGTGTQLSNYTTVISGACAANGTVTVQSADNLVCTVTNTALTGTLTVNEVTQPGADPGRFTLRVDGTTAGSGGNVANGGTTGTLTVGTGSHTVSQGAGTGTTLSNYVTVIGGDCAPSGVVTINSGDNKVCTVTNSLKATLTLKQHTDKANADTFSLLIDSTSAGTGRNFTASAVQVSPGTHLVGEAAGPGTSLANYQTTISGACSGSGVITLTPGQSATCTISNAFVQSAQATLTINEATATGADQGKFSLQIDGAVQGAAVPASGATGSSGAIVVAAGSHWVSEIQNSVPSAGPEPYSMIVSGDCNQGGAVVLNPGDNKVCTITNSLRSAALPRFTLQGTVFQDSATSGIVLSGVSVYACEFNLSTCQVVQSAGNGTYSIPNLAVGTYDLRALKVSDFTLAIEHLYIAQSTSGTVTHNFVLVQPAGPPAGTTVSSAFTTTNNTPVITWNSPFTLKTVAAPGSNLCFQVLLSGSVRLSGGLTEGPAGNFTATVPSMIPDYGRARVVIGACATPLVGTVNFDLYIDPSGVVVDQTGTPVVGATVTLLSAPAADGTFTAVANGSATMSPANRVNPDLSHVDGSFGWDVLPGFYQVTATKSGCTQVAGSATAVLTIPPPVTNLVLTLSCPGGDVNGDGAISSVDALCILRSVAGFAGTANCPVVPLTVPSAGDVNSDGSVTSVDALCILRYVAGLPATANCPSLAAASRLPRSAPPAAANDR